MNIEQIVKEWLIAHGYDGLCHIDAECGCEVEDLMPCSAPCLTCEPGYKAKCDNECGHDVYGLHDWHIQQERAEV